MRGSKSLSDRGYSFSAEDEAIIGLAGGVVSLAVKDVAEGLLIYHKKGICPTIEMVDREFRKMLQKRQYFNGKTDKKQQKMNKLQRFVDAYKFLGSEWGQALSGDAGFHYLLVKTCEITNETLKKLLLEEKKFSWGKYKTNNIEDVLNTEEGWKEAGYKIRKGKLPYVEQLYKVDDDNEFRLETTELYTIRMVDKE